MPLRDYEAFSPEVPAAPGCRIDLSRALLRARGGDDPQCLDQVVAVARRHAIDLARIEAWSEREDSAQKFDSLL